jgi:dihydrodipicolinate synthase/N-acetylneuraminate lyase
MPAAGADAIVSVVPYYNKAGLYDASGDAMRPVRLRLGMDFRLPCGDDAGALAHLAQRGDGCISVTSNVAPRPLPKYVPGLEARAVGPRPELGASGR